MRIGTLTVLRHTVNYEAMCRFYGDALGMSVIERLEAPESRGSVFAPPGAVTNASIEVLELGDVCVEGVAPVNVVLTLFVDDARLVHDELLGVGMVIARGLEDTPWGHRSFGIDDPDGLRIWVVQVLGVV